MVAVGAWTLGHDTAEKELLEDMSYCAAPPSKDCSDYVEVIEEWMKEHERCEDKWLQTQNDLARCQLNKNTDCMCTDATCR